MVVHHPQGGEGDGLGTGEVIVKFLCGVAAALGSEGGEGATVVWELGLYGDLVEVALGDLTPGLGTAEAGPFLDPCAV